MALRPAAFVGPVALATVAAACSLGDFASFSDGDPLTDGGATDATNASDGGGDSPADANDAGGDALADAGGTFCETNGDAGFFCADFEKTGALDAFDVVKTQSGTVVVESGTMVVDAPASSAEAIVGGVKSAKTGGAHAQISFSVQPEVLNATTNNGSQLAKIYFFASGKAAYEVGVGVKGGTSSAVYAYEFTEGVSYKEFGDLAPLSAGKMTRFVLDARIDMQDPVGPSINLDRDGVRVITDADLSPPAATGAIEMVIGLAYLPANHGAWKFRFDDILMRLPP